MKLKLFSSRDTTGERLLKKTLQLIRSIFSTVGRILFHQDYLVLKTELAENKGLKQDNQLHLLKELLIAAEDRRFYYHIGFDIYSMLRAFWTNVSSKKFQGASTIDQQLVRTVIKDYKKTYHRKIKEIFLAPCLTDFIDRDDIPITYLHRIYYGTDMLGMDAAIRMLKKRNPEINNRQICVALVARIKYPEPRNNTGRIQEKIEIREKYLSTLLLRLGS